MSEIKQIKTGVAEHLTSCEIWMLGLDWGEDDNPPENKQLDLFQTKPDDNV